MASPDPLKYDRPYTTPGMYKVPGKFIKFVGEEYRVVKRDRDYQVYGEEYNEAISSSFIY